MMIINNKTLKWFKDESNKDILNFNMGMKRLLIWFKDVTYKDLLAFIVGIILAVIIIVIGSLVVTSPKHL